jgi:hypothetical protein
VLVHQPPLPLERMVKESPVTPLDVPMYPRAAAVWQKHGYLPEAWPAVGTLRT